jgi:hypothetical protein
MDYLGRLNGTGRIVVGGADIGSATYNIRVYRRMIVARDLAGTGDRFPGRKEARGRIEADPSVIQRIQNEKVATLKLPNGETVDFRVTGSSSSRADITVTGPIPLGV